MKRAKILSFLLLVIYTILLMPMQAHGYKLHLSEDFENYSKSNWHPTASGGTIMEMDGNKFIVLNKTVSENRRLMNNDTGTTPTIEGQENKGYFVSSDFMVPSENGSTQFEVLGSRYSWGGGEGCHIWYVWNELESKGELRFGTSSAPGDVVAFEADIQFDKWYNIFAFIDYIDTSKTPKYTVYFGELKSEENAFPTSIETAISINGGQPVAIGRFFEIVENSSGDAYIDNVNVMPVVDFELEEKLLIARSMLINSEIGYEDDKYPQSSIDMLTDSFADIDSLVRGETTYAENVCETSTVTINAAVEKFKNSKIDTTSTDEETTYILINGSGEMITAGATLPNEDFTMVLDAKSYNKATVETNEEIIWSLETPYDDVVLDAETSTLTVKSGFQGNITLKAMCNDIYAIHNLKMVSIRDILISSVNCEGGTIEICGSLSDTIKEGLCIEVVGEDGDDSTTDIDVSGSIIVEDDNSFVWTQSIEDDNRHCQNLTITISGTETVAKEIKSYYYGENWKDVILADVNDATESSLDEILLLHSDKLFVDCTLLSQETDIYCKRIKNKVYESINEVCDEIDAVEFILNHKNVTRDEIKNLISSNVILLKNNGFDLEEKLKGLSEQEVMSFYLNAAVLEIDASIDTVADIVEEYNSIIKGLKKETSDGGSTVTRPSSGGSGGSGGSGIAAGSKLNKFEVELVSSDETENKETITPETKTAFEDIDENHWAYTAIAYMNEKGIMVGSENKVRPDDSITRGEFAKIIVEALALENGEKEKKFSDTTGNWWGPYAEIAASYQIVNGMSSDFFGGNEQMTREMLAVMVDRAIQGRNIALYEQLESVQFVDASYISDYAVESVNRLAIKGIVSGVGNDVFAPKLKVTRAEAAQILYNVLKQVK